MTIPNENKSRQPGEFRKVSLIALTGMGALLGQSALVSAQENAGASSFMIEEVVVTATRREEKLTDVPLSIQALGGDALERQGAVNFADYARGIAGVAFVDNGPGRSQIFMRGVSTGVDVDTGKESTVGVYIDEVPVSEGSSQPDLRLYDIDRVEVLRGPQGTVYGSGSLGGTVRVLTKKPVLGELSGNVSAQASTTRHGGENEAINGVINIPVSEDLAVRVVGYGIHNDGFIENGFTGEEKIDDEHTSGARIAALYIPNDKLDATLTTIYQKSKYGSYTRAADNVSELVLLQSAPEPFRDRLGTVNLTLNLDMDFATLTSSTSYFDRSRYFENDIDYFLELGFGLPRGESQLDYDAETISQELRLTSNGDGALQWLVGGFYLDREDDFRQTINPLGTGSVPTPGLNLYYSETLADIEQLAGFTEVNYEIREGLIATVGGRVSRTKRDVDTMTDGAVSGGIPTVVAGDFTETSVTPKFNLSYALSEYTLLYTQVTKGFRVGGVNPGLPPCSALCTVDVDDTFDSDSLWNYELGLKQQSEDGRFTMAAAIFWIEWEDIQLNVNRGDGFNGVLNAGSARSRGVELEFSGRSNEHFHFGGQVTYTDADLRSLSDGIIGFVDSGERLPGVPQLSASVNAELGTQLGDLGWLYVRGDIQYVGDRKAALTSDPETLDSYTISSLRVGLDLDTWSAAIFADNLTDERAELDFVSNSGLRDGVPVTFNRYTVNVPRTIGIRLSKHF
ncbi:TonB-dependent receptor [Kineobactrum salinum]|uniref:TonB-dependent receptor n=1 Tax=Kineobactrum salinum TaxID=2708301 RepID=A0A6C0TXP2_9GAMM|nr:TonB-dependent receptor [Kineobactrum salinum]QIB64600.1 TonB-dependent receptor [Kineobactrum salinum]